MTNTTNIVENITEVTVEVLETRTEITIEVSEMGMQGPAGPPGQSSIFTTDFEYNLRSGDSLGKLKGTGIYPTIGKSQEQFLREIANDYIVPAFTSFNISGQPTTVEVGTTLSGSKTFNWGITLNNGIIPTIDIYDNTSGTTLLSATPNDGSQVQTITPKQLNSNGATQSWKAIGNNDNEANINSGNFVVTALFNRYWGAVSTYPSDNSNGILNRVYANALNNAFKTNGINTFTLSTGTTLNKFIVILPQGVTITSVIDLSNLNADVTSEYILSTITVKDAGGTDRTFNQYRFSPTGTYPVSANHQIKTT